MRSFLPFPWAMSIFSLAWSIKTSAGVTYYVAPPGHATARDSSGFGTRANPFATTAYAAKLLDGVGGVVVLLDGVYSNANFGSNDVWKIEQTIRLNSIHGTASSPIVIKGDTPTGHTLKGDGNIILQLRVSSHVVLEDLNILGEVQNIPLQDAWDHRFEYKVDGDSTVYQRVDPTLTPEQIEALGPLPDISNKVIIRPSLYTTDGLLVQSSRHVTIRNCRIGYMPGTGLRVQSSDYVTVENNTVHNSSRRSSAGNHGMVIHSVTNKVDGITITDEGYRIKIIGNTVYDNFNEVYSWSSLKTFVTPHIDEGKGITVQKTDSTFDRGTGRILIANNVVYNNGFSGIHTNYATKVDIYFNTAVENTATGKGTNAGISVSDSQKCNVINNIAYSTNTFGGEVYSTDSTNLVGNEIVFKKNLAVGIIDSIFDASDFIMATASELGLLSAPEYRVSSTSLAVDAGDASILSAVPFDKDGSTRGSNPDLGAYEVAGSIGTPSSPINTPTSPPTLPLTASPTNQPTNAPTTAAPTPPPIISYYVGPPGHANAQDTAGYGTRDAPFATTEYAVKQLDGVGGLVILMDGVYTNANYRNGDIWKVEQTIRIGNVHGTATSPIIIMGETPTGHILKGDGNNIFQLRTSSHVILENLNIVGEVENIPLQDAWDHRFDYKIEGDSTVYQRVNPDLSPADIESLTLPDISGLSIIRPSLYTTDGFVLQVSRHITIRNCRISYMPGTGLQVYGSDFVTVEGNIVHNNSRRSSVGTHGLMVHSTSNVVGGVSVVDNGYRIKVIGNTVYQNYNEVYSWSNLKTFITPHIDEGKGISIQKTGSTFDNGTGRILIANNVAYSNGLSGIHLQYTTKVDIFFNTVVENTFYGWGKNTGISLQYSYQCRIVNNIAFSLNTFGGLVYNTDSSNPAGDGLVFGSNIAVGGLGKSLNEADFIVTTPDALDLRAGSDYRISSRSIAVNAGDPLLLSVIPFDKDGNTRDSIPDLGAYEVVSLTPLTSSPTKAATNTPTKSPSNALITSPTEAPSKTPTKAPSNIPTKIPTKAPSNIPTKIPTKAPSNIPTKVPTKAPIKAPNSAEPPSNKPSQSKAPSIDIFENLQSVEIQIPSKLVLEGVKIPKDPIQLDAVVSTLEGSIKASALVKLQIKRRKGKLRIRVVIKSINGEPIDNIRKKLVSTNVVERRLQQAEEEALIEYDLIVEEICADETTGVCSNTGTLATELYNTATESVREQIQSGAFLVQLQKMATELNIADFVAETSVQGSDFTKLAEVLIDILSSFYPDWETPDGYCKNDGNEPPYMIVNPTWTTGTLQECCSKYFSWALKECLGSSVTEADTSSLVWYADWLGTDTCSNDVANAPGYMLSNREGWMFSTKEACCKKFYGWSFAECMGDAYTATGPKGWYIDWVIESCVKSCPASSDDIECGGYGATWNYMYESASACCQQLQWVPINDCLKK